MMLEQLNIHVQKKKKVIIYTDLTPFMKINSNRS